METIAFSSPGAALRAARLAKGLTQQDVATEAHVTQAHLSRIERDDLSVKLPVLQRVARAVGLQLSFEPASLGAAVKDPYGDDVIANRQYLLGRLAARRITGETLDRFRTWLEGAIERLGDYRYFGEWVRLCDQGPSAVARVLVDATEYGRYMRAVATMRPFVTQAERDAFYQPQPPYEALIS